MQQVCPCPHLSSVQKSHFSQARATATAAKPIQKRREREAQSCPSGERQGLWGITALHFSSPQHLLTFPMSCQNRNSPHPFNLGESRDAPCEFSPLSCPKYFLITQIWFDRFVIPWAAFLLCYWCLLARLFAANAPR